MAKGIGLRFSFLDRFQALSAQSTTIRGIINGVHSDWVYRTLEASVDGIIDFRLQESGRQMKKFMRIRSLRNVAFDSEWHALNIYDNFRVTLE